MYSKRRGRRQDYDKSEIEKNKTADFLAEHKVIVTPGTLPSDYCGLFETALSASALKSAALVQFELDNINKQESEHIKNVHDKYNQIRKNRRLLQRKFLAKVPYFWCEVFKNHPFVGEFLEEDPLACNVLQTLVAFDVEDIEDTENLEHFRFNFHFDRVTVREYMAYGVITYEYKITKDEEFEVKASPIKWKRSAIEKVLGPEHEAVQLGAFFEYLKHDKELIFAIKEDVFCDPLSYYLPDIHTTRLLKKEKLEYYPHFPYVDPQQPISEFFQNYQKVNLSEHDNLTPIAKQFRDMKALIVQQQSIIDAFNKKDPQEEGGGVVLPSYLKLYFDKSIPHDVITPVEKDLEEYQQQPYQPPVSRRRAPITIHINDHGTPKKVISVDNDDVQSISSEVNDDSVTINDSLVNESSEEALEQLLEETEASGT